MIHLLFDKRPWFAAKRFGYGAGLPITWQGWVLTLSYIGLMTGIALLAGNGGVDWLASGIMMLVSTAVFCWIAYRRTAGGWRWRSGD